MTYAEKLRDPRWQKKRLEIFLRDEWSCQSCRRRDQTLNCHHRWYVRGKEPWEYENEALVTLCEDCHQTESEFRKDVELELIAALRKKFLVTDLASLMTLIEAADRVGVHGVISLIETAAGWPPGDSWSPGDTK